MSSADTPESGGASIDDGESPAFDTSVAHQARVYDYLLGGKDNYAADRAYAEAAILAYPGAVATACVNRAFLGRAVRYLATEARVSQFLDIGTGIPSSGSTHQVAQAVEPGSRIVYVDNDPVVLAHARALLVSGEHGATDYIDADLRKPEVILDRAVRTLDFTRPAAPRRRSRGSLTACIWWNPEWYAPRTGGPIRGGKRRNRFPVGRGGAQAVSSSRGCGTAGATHPDARKRAVRSRCRALRSLFLQRFP